MKTETYLFALVLGLMLPATHAETTINTVNRHAFGANVGWMDARGDAANGAVIGEYICSGYIYAANVGWIHLGDGSPANGIQYQHSSGSDYGINHDGIGNLRGNGYGANIGWVVFEANGDPEVNLVTGELSGYIWSANCGWISLNNAGAFVQTDVLQPGPDSDGDEIGDAWELGHTNALAVLAGGLSDYDGDGVSDVEEYAADTDPLDAGDFLAITDFQVEASTNRIAWPVKATRLYTLQHAFALSSGMVWTATAAPFIPPADTDMQEEVSGVTEALRFYRVEAKVPLGP